MRCNVHVRFTPNSDRESELPQTVMSALPPKAEICAAQAHVCFGPEADIWPAWYLPFKTAPVLLSIASDHEIRAAPAVSRPMAPTSIRLIAHTTSRLNQLLERNFKPSRS